MKILTVGHRKMDDVVYDISTRENEAAAFLAVFLIFDLDWQFYSDLQDEDKAEDTDANWQRMREWYLKACSEDAPLEERTHAARRLMEFRKRQGYEYEDEWNIRLVSDPQDELLKQQVRRRSRRRSRAGRS